MTEGVGGQRTMNRREFLKLGLVAAATGFFFPDIVRLVGGERAEGDREKLLRSIMYQEDKPVGRRGVFLGKEAEELAASARRTGYLCAPGIFSELEDNLWKCESLGQRRRRVDPRIKGLTGMAADLIEQQISFWRDIPEATGRAEFVGFEGDQGQRFKKYILAAMRAVWGDGETYSKSIGGIELRRDFAGGGECSHDGNAVVYGGSLMTAEERRKAADSVLHEVVVGHRMDPVVCRGIRFLDMRDVLFRGGEWFKLSVIVPRFLMVMGGPELVRQNRFEEAKRLMTPEAIESLKLEGNGIFERLSEIGILVREENARGASEYFGYFQGGQEHMVDFRPLFSEFKTEMDKLGDDYRDAGTALLAFKILQQMGLTGIRVRPFVPRLIADLNKVLEEQVRQEQEMIVEVIRHVLTLDSVPAGVSGDDFRKLEGFVGMVLSLYGGRSLAEARKYLKAVRNQFIGR